MMLGLEGICSTKDWVDHVLLPREDNDLLEEIPVAIKHITYAEYQLFGNYDYFDINDLFQLEKRYRRKYHNDADFHEEVQKAWEKINIVTDYDSYVLKLLVCLREEERFNNQEFARCHECDDESMEEQNCDGDVEMIVDMILEYEDEKKQLEQVSEKKKVDIDKIDKLKMSFENSISNYGNYIFDLPYMEEVRICPYRLIQPWHEVVHAVMFDSFGGEYDVTWPSGRGLLHEWNKIVQSIRVMRNKFFFIKEQQRINRPKHGGRT